MKIIITYLALGFMFSSLVWSHLSCKCSCLFHFVIFQYFHSYDVSYFMLIRVCNFVIFSYCIEQCVKFVLVKFEIRVISICGYKPHYFNSLQLLKTLSLIFN